MDVHSIVTTGSTAQWSVNLMQGTQGTAHSMMQSIYVIKRIRHNVLKVSMMQLHEEGVLSVANDIIPG